MLAFGARTTGVEIAKQMIKIFLSTEFTPGENDKHQKRLDKLNEIGEDI